MLRDYSRNPGIYRNVDSYQGVPWNLSKVQSCLYHRRLAHYILHAFFQGRRTRSNTLDGAMSAVDDDPDVDLSLTGHLNLLSNAAPQAARECTAVAHPTPTT